MRWMSRRWELRCVALSGAELGFQQGRKGFDRVADDIKAIGYILLGHRVLQLTSVT